MLSRDGEILLIDDTLGHAEAVRAALPLAGIGATNLEWTRTLASGLETLAHKKVRAVVLNLFLPDSWGIETLDRLLPAAASIPILVLLRLNDEDLCKMAILHGAQDFLLEKNLDSYALARAIRKISEREVAQLELFATQALGPLRENADVKAVLTTDASGKITYLNAAAEQMTGWSKEKAIGQPLTDVFQIIDGVTRGPAANPVESAIYENWTDPRVTNCILVRRDGHESAIEDSAVRIHGEDGAVTGVVVAFHEVGAPRRAVLEILKWT
jgi:PAS domain S-box-containing protein